MFVSYHKGTVLFRTPYNDAHDLVQMFRGMDAGTRPYNNPVDFKAAGLIRRDKGDMWHLDIPLAISTDESPALTVNDAHIGANHGQPGALCIEAPGHGKTMADVGSLWRDEAGTQWTLLHVEDDILTVMSENIGPSYDAYAFKKEPDGALSYVENGENTAPIPTDGAKWGVWLQPVNRYQKRKVYVFKEGTLLPFRTSTECEYAEIHEEYDIVHPVSLVETLRHCRPEGGYTFPRYGAVGKPMIHVNGVYRIEGDGTVIYHFTHTKCADVHFGTSMAAMFQEKQDAFGGGVHRYIPKLKPLITPEGTFDFSIPYDISPGPFPANCSTPASTWESPDAPPDRIVDYLRDAEGHDRLGFACGYLPLYDGVPEIRSKTLACAVHIIRTRKGYPFFMSGDVPGAHGIAYKKYFATDTDRASVYTIPAEGKTYIYMDFFAENTLEIPVNGKITLHEKSEGIEYKTENGILTACGEKGYAVFICN